MTLSKQPVASAIRSGARNSARALTLAVGVVCATPAAAAGEAPDMKEFLDTITRTGMSEVAANLLRSEASIRVGGAILGFNKIELTGIYAPTYQGMGCPLPGAEKKFQERQAQVRKLAERDVQILKVQADADGSGFVTTQEARDYRNLLQFGYKAAYIVEAERRADAETIAKGAGIEREEASTRIKKYNLAAKKLNEASGDSRMPLVPLEP